MTDWKMGRKEQMEAVAEATARAKATKKYEDLGVLGGDGVTFIETTPDILTQVERQATDLAKSVDQMLFVLSGKMQDITARSREYSQLYDNLISGTEQSIDLAITQMGCLVSKCQHLEMELAPVDSMAAEIQSIKQVLDHFERVLKQTVFR